MAAFDQQEDSRKRLDWEILRDGGINLYLRREYLDADIDWLRSQHYQVFPFDCTKWRSSEVMHADFARTLSFPSYYGKNLDALHDCLEEDLFVPDVGGVALILDRFDVYAKAQGTTLIPSGRAEAEVLLDILARATRYFLLTGRRLLTLVQSDDPEIRFDKLACVFADWNRREWLYKNRGLDS
jgi:Barstar (barnase inhibitor)